MERSKLTFKKEQLRLALVGATEYFNDVYCYNYGCEGDCSGSCLGCCADACTDKCTGSCSGSCEGGYED